MSGGSWNYLCYQVQEAAQRLLHEKDATRRAFGKHLKLVAEALHAIEWVDSDDKGPGDEIEPIMACITPQDILNASVQDARDMIDRLEKIIKQCE
jgi:hypothetical protein